MADRKIAFVVGHAHWGKSRTLRALTKGRLNRTTTIGDVCFFIRRRSNDDESDSYVKFVKTIDKTLLIAALCPNFHNKQTKTEFILNTLHKKGYEMFFWVIEQQQNGGLGIITKEEIGRLEQFGKCKKFSKLSEPDIHAKEFHKFVLDTVLA